MSKYPHPRHPELVRGLAIAQQVFDEMSSDPDWNGQCSTGFAATFIQQLDLFMDPNHPMPNIEIRAAFYPPDQDRTTKGSS